MSQTDTKNSESNNTIDYIFGIEEGIRKIDVEPKMKNTYAHKIKAEPISTDLFRFETHLRKRDQESFAVVANYLQNHGINSYLFGSVLEKPRKYGEINILGVSERNHLDYAYQFLKAGFKLPIIIDNINFYVQKLPSLIAESRLKISPVQNNFRKRFFKISSIDLSLMTEDNFRLFVEI